MEPRAPAAGEHALVPLDESGELVERLRRERLDRVVGHTGNLTRVADVRRPVAHALSGRYTHCRGRGAARPGVPLDARTSVRGRWDGRCRGGMGWLERRDSANARLAVRRPVEVTAVDASAWVWSRFS